MLAPDRSRSASSRGRSRGRSHLFTQKGTLFTIIDGPLLPKSWGESEGNRRVVAGLRGIGPALAGKLGGGFGFRASREGKVRSLPMLAPDRSRSRLGTLTLSEQWERRFPMVRGVREACSGAAGGFH